jgi:hypothetical protein
MASMGGRTVLRGSAAASEGEWEDLGWELELGRERGGWSVPVEEGPMLSRRGDFWWVRTAESLDGRAKDCSKGLGSRSNVERFGRGGGR